MVTGSECIEYSNGVFNYSLHNRWFAQNLGDGPYKCSVFLSPDLSRKEKRMSEKCPEGIGSVHSWIAAINLLFYPLLPVLTLQQ